MLFQGNNQKLKSPSLPFKGDVGMKDTYLRELIFFFQYAFVWFGAPHSAAVCESLGKCIGFVEKSVKTLLFTVYYLKIFQKFKLHIFELELGNLL
jgi:hypothetical protein